LTQRVERALGPVGVAPFADPLHAVDLLALELWRDAQYLERSLVLRLVAVDAHDDPFAALDLLLEAEGRLRDLPLREVLLDRLDHPAQLVDLAEVLVGGLLHAIGE